MKAHPPPQPFAIDPHFSVPAKWQWHLQTLLRLRNRLQRQSREHLDEAENPRELDHDFVAQASDESEFKSLIAEVQSEEVLLAEIEAALDRLHRGTYGLCEASQLPIPAARLRAVPWTRYRREVAEGLER
jgi:RNA polymerase-binding transcription factor DksA